MITDTHCHLDASPLAEDVEAALARARAVGVCRVLVPGVRPAEWDALVALRDRHAEVVSIAIGIHPQCLPEMDEAERDRGLESLESRALASGAIAIGECGLDGGTARDHGVSLEAQAAIVRRHVEVADRLALPLVVHAQDAMGASLALFEALGPRRHGAILHAFGGPAELVSRWARLGFWFGIGPAITWPRARRPKEAARAVPLERLLVETDAPGTYVHASAERSGEPAEARAVLDALAALRELEPAALEAVLRENERRAFPAMR
jgi:TatD DNase family protein